MKKHLLYSLLPLVALIAFSCSEDPAAEDPFIDNSDQEGVNGSGNPYWDWADKYPGPVSALIERAFDVEVLVKGSYGVIAYAPDKPVLQSTGLYAPGDETIEVIVPPGVTDLHYQIGIGYELPDQQIKMRYKDVVTNGSLQPGSNNIMSYFGGYLYFYYPAGSTNSADITVTVNGAVESCDYIEGETDLRDWLAVVQQRAAILAAGTEDKDSTAFLNWTELRSDKVILTLGIPEMSEMTNPETVLGHYGDIADSYLRFGGYDPEGQPPMRVYTDIQLPDPGQNSIFPNLALFHYGGYPVGYVRGEKPTSFVDEKKIINTNILQAQNDSGYGNWYEVLYGFSDAVREEWQNTDYFHMPSFTMGYYHYARSIGKWPGKFIDFASNIDRLNISVHYLDDTQKYMIYDIVSDDVRTTMLMQLGVYVGWGLFPYLNEAARREGYVNEYDQDANDFFVMTVCEYAGENLIDFFRLWHFPYSEYAYKYCINFPAPAREFWKSLTNNDEPAFDKRTPNTNFERGPKPALKWHEKNDWKMTSYVTNPYTNDTIRVKNDSNVVDGDVDTHLDIGGHLVIQHGDSLSYVVHSYMDMGDIPLRINAFSIYHERIYFINRLHGIEYWDEAAQDWKPTFPDEIIGIHSLEERHYFFEETFETTKIRFYAQPKVNNWTGNYRLMRVRELSVGLIE